MIRKPTASTAAAWAVAACIAALTVGKLIEPSATLAVFREVWHLADAVADAGFVLLIGVEAMIVTLLLWRSWRTAGFALAAGFLLVVSASLIRQIIEGSTAPCGCGGTDKATGPLDHGLALARNSFLLSLTTFGLWQSPAMRTLASRLTGHITLPFLFTRTPSCSPQPTGGDAAASAASPS